MYLFEIRDIKYTRKCILSSKSQTGIEYLWACYNSVLRYYYFRISEYQRNHCVLTLKSTNKYNLCNNGIRASKQI